MASTAAPATDRDAATLCTRCGLCCAGLFAKVRLFPADLALASRVGEPSLRSENRVYARLPCAFLEGTRCSVYPERYTACRTFECKLLRRFMRGDVSAATAQHRVSEMRRLLVAVRAATSEEALGQERAEGSPAPVTRLCDLADPDARREHARALLLRATFTLYANTHFRPGPDPAGLA